MILERRPCAAEGCARRGRNKGTYKGQRRYGKFCEQHHRALRYEDKHFLTGEPEIPNKTCIRCGWDKAPCDRHRIDKDKGYVPDNVKVLCPNCHRLERMGL